jgi:hypothetical protein
MKLPYGQSNFKNISTEGFYYVDRTQYIENLENLAGRYLFYLRPRKFGKSLFISMLRYYYGEEWKEQFNDLFGKYYIGHHPTSLANSYLVLKLDFSGILTDTSEEVYKHFTIKVRNGVKDFFTAYSYAYSEEDYDLVDTIDSPAALLDSFFSLVQKRSPGRKIYILIDEYDHFANELVAFHLHDFKEIVSGNGFVRKFFEIIKEATGEGLVDRMFVTGVSPVTLDSLTSGFNISKKISLEPDLHEMMGFTEAEAVQMLSHIGVVDASMPSIISELRNWYNGYLFHPDASERLYNPNMLVYFCDHYQKYQKFPERLLDENIASDYSKIRRMLGIGGDRAGMEILEQVLAEGWVRANLTIQFTFDRSWVRDDYTSLLFYLGMLTVKGRAGVAWSFQAPNFVIKSLFYDYFVETLRLHANLKENLYAEISDALYVLSMENEIAPLVHIVEKLLSRLSGRDVQKFDESHLHAIFAALLSSSQAYLVRSQPEVERRFVDLLCTMLPGIPINWNYAFELKYLKKKDATQLTAKREEAISQLKDYLRSDDLRTISNLAAYVIVFVGDKAKIIERVQ